MFFLPFAFLILSLFLTQKAFASVLVAEPKPQTTLRYSHLRLKDDISEISASHKHPTVTLRPIKAALLIDTEFKNESRKTAVWMSFSNSSSVPLRTMSLMPALSLTPYVSEGVPPATLTLGGLSSVHSTTARINSPSAKVYTPKNEASQAGEVVLKGSLRMRLGIRDLHVSPKSPHSAETPEAFGLALPNGFLVSEIVTWSYQGITKHEAAVGYSLLSDRGFLIDLLVPKYIVFGYQMPSLGPKIYFISKIDSLYRVPLIAQLKMLPSETTDSPDLNRLTQGQKEEPANLEHRGHLEHEKKTSFAVGLQHKIFRLWFVNLEIGRESREWTLLNRTGVLQKQTKSDFGHFLAFGITSLIAPLSQPVQR